MSIAECVDTNLSGPERHAVGLTVNFVMSIARWPPHGYLNYDLGHCRRPWNHRVFIGDRPLPCYIHENTCFTFVQMKGLRTS